MWMLLLISSVAPPVAEPLPPGAIARLGGRSWRLPSESRSLAFSPDGKLLATVNREGVALLDPETGLLLRTLVRPEWRKEARVLTWDASSKLIHVEDGESLYRVDPEGNRIDLRVAGACAVRVGRNMLVTLTHEGTRGLCVNDTTLKPITSFPLRWSPLGSSRARTTRSLTGHPTRPEFAYATTDHRLVVQEATTGALRWQVRGHGPASANVERVAGDLSLAYSPSGTWLASGGSDGTVRLWSAVDGKAGPVLSMGNLPCLGLQWTTGEQLVALFADGTVEVFENGKCRHRWKSPVLADCSCWCVSPLGDRVASLTNHGADLCCWDLRTGRALHRSLAHLGSIQRMQWMDDRHFFTIDDSGVLFEWDRVTGRGSRRAELGSGPCALRPDGQQVAIPSRFMNSVRLIDLPSGRQVASVPCPELSQVTALDYTPDGRHLVLLSRVGQRWRSNHLRLWNLTQARVETERTIDEVLSLWCRLTFFESTKEVGIFSRDMSDFPGASWVRFRYPDLSRTASLRFKASGDYLAVHSSRVSGVLLRHQPSLSKFEFVDLRSGRTLDSWDLPIGSLSATQFSPCGRFLIIAGRQNDAAYLKVREIRSMHLLRNWVCNSEVTQMAFSPGGRYLATADEQGQILLWDLIGPVASEINLATAWDSLAASEGSTPLAAVGRLAATPETSVPFLASKIRPDVPIAAQRFAALLEELDSEDFATRQQAEQTLRQNGSVLVTQVKEALAQAGQSLERSKRLCRIQASWPTEATLLQRDRAVYALEQMGEPGRALLYRLAEGAPEAEITQLARKALHRRR